MSLRLRQEAQKLVKVRLSDVDVDVRLAAARRVREREHAEWLRDRLGGMPHAVERSAGMRMLHEAVEVERRALFPRGVFIVSENAASKVLGDGA